MVFSSAGLYWGIHNKTGMSKETAQSALKEHKQKTLGESRKALLKQIIQS